MTTRKTQVAYWQKPDGECASYEIIVTPAEKGRKGFWEYQAALGTISQISSTLKPEGYKLKYKDEDENATAGA